MRRLSINGRKMQTDSGGRLSAVHPDNIIYIQKEEWRNSKGDEEKESITMISIKACIIF